MEVLKNKKSLLIILAAFLGIVLIAAAVALIIRGRSGSRFGNSDAPYPYSWVEKKDGTITMTLETGDAANGEWSLASTEGAAAEASVGQTGGKKTSVTITPSEQGLTFMTFALTSGEERLAELSVTASVDNADEKLSASITSHRERAFQSVVRGGEETGHPFIVRADDEGLTIFVEEPEGYTDDGMAWESESTNSMAASVSDIDVSGEGVTFRLEAGTSGNAEVRVYSARENISYVFDVAVTGGEMLLTGSRWEPYEAGESEEETERTEAGEDRENI